MAKENQNNKPNRKLKKKYRDEMEAENLTIDQYLGKKLEEQEKLKKLINQIFSAITPGVQRPIGNVSLNDNVANLGFKKRFFTEEDAVFVMQKVEKLIEDDAWESEPLTQEEYDDLFQTHMHTGVCYAFENLGVTLYTTWQFVQSNYEGGESYIDYQYIAYSYNHYSQEFREINDDESFPIEFAV